MSTARTHNECAAVYREVLQQLRTGMIVVRHQWEGANPGSRIAPSIDRLRNAHGFEIETTDGPTGYRLLDKYQMPTKVEVTKVIQEAYYDSDHWARIRNARFTLDSHLCQVCKSHDNLRCHHLVYQLFFESISDLLTVCDDCHEKLHADSRLKFPSGILIERARILFPDISFPQWTLPPVRATTQCYAF